MVKVDMRIVEKYMSFLKDEDRENYIYRDADANKETLQFLLNDETSNELAETLEGLISEIEEECA